MLSEVNTNFSSDFSGIRDTASKEMKKKSHHSKAHHTESLLFQSCSVITVNGWLGTE